MKIYPAIDIKGGQCVRLTQGIKDQETVYDQDPAAVALKWQNKGAKQLHIVDLDGAFEGEPKNLKTIQQILLDIIIPIQVGGGIRSGETVEKYLSLGVSRVIVGTKAIESPEFIEELIREFNDKIVIGIDARNGYVATHGWVQDTKISAIELAQQVEMMGCKTIVYTDISKDGMLDGPNYQAMEEMVLHTNLEVIASGGISQAKDVKLLSQLESKGLLGIIIGKALYTGSIQLEDIV